MIYRYSEISKIKPLFISSSLPSLSFSHSLSSRPSLSNGPIVNDCFLYVKCDRCIALDSINGCLAANFAFLSGEEMFSYTWLQKIIGQIIFHASRKEASIAERIWLNIWQGIKPLTRKDLDSGETGRLGGGENNEDIMQICK